MRTVLRAEKVSKAYKISRGTGSLRQDFQSFWARLRGKEDPNTPIGSPAKSRWDAEQHFWALRDVTFDLKEGQILGILGHNGAGKSTLLKILSRITAPTEGVIKIKGRIASLLEIGTGFHPELSGRENVFLNGSILGMTRREIRAKFDEIVNFAEIADFIDIPVKRYSSGMYVRLAFAVAAHLDAETMIVDEVLAVGDERFQKKCIAKMDSLRHNGRTLILVSHSTDTVKNLCTIALCLKAGEMVSFGAVNKVVKAYRDYTS
jgi:lipopolysaccharide transport system ATP-binding protein